MESLENLIIGFKVALQPEVLLYCFLGVFMGTLVGVLPGLGTATAIAILLPVTLSLPQTAAIVMLAGIYYGAMYGGSTTSILINIPGEAASVVTCLDGYQMARQGKAGPALGMAAISSFIAGTLSLIGVVFLAPPLAEVALTFGPPEHFAILMLALTLIISMAGKSLSKGLICGLIGLLVGMIGMDPQTGITRYTFGTRKLIGGIDFISVIVGIFAIAEVFTNIEEPAREVYNTKLKKLLPSLQDLKVSKHALWRGTVIGFFLGLLPGITAAVTSFIAYDIEKRLSKNSDLFGKGAIEGVAVAEGSNNSSTSGGFIPLFTLGLPTTPALAVLLGALMIQGLQPGPLLFEQHKEFIWGVIASMYIGNVMLLILNLPLVGLWVKLTKIPYTLLGPGVLSICFIGTYGLRNNMFDVWMMLAFGFLGYIMRKLEFPSIPMIIALILGDRIESSFHQSLRLSDGSFWIFISRPISATLLTIALLSVIFSLYARRKKPKISNLLTQGEPD